MIHTCKLDRHRLISRVMTMTSNHMYPPPHNERADEPKGKRVREPESIPCKLRASRFLGSRPPARPRPPAHGRTRARALARSRAHAQTRKHSHTHAHTALKSMPICVDDYASPFDLEVSVVALPSLPPSLRPFSLPLPLHSSSAPSIPT